MTVLLGSGRSRSFFSLMVVVASSSFQFLSILSSSLWQLLSFNCHIMMVPVMFVPPHLLFDVVTLGQFVGSYRSIGSCQMCGFPTRHGHAITATAIIIITTTSNGSSQAQSSKESCLLLLLFLWQLQWCWSCLDR